MSVPPGLSAKGKTTVEEVQPTRLLTEEMLERFGARVSVDPRGSRRGSHPVPRTPQFAALN